MLFSRENFIALFVVFLSIFVNMQYTNPSITLFITTNTILLPKNRTKREECFKTKTHVFWNVTVCVMPLYLNILSFPSKLDIAKTFL